MSLHNPKKEINDLIRNISTTYAYSRSRLFVCCDRGDVCVRGRKGDFLPVCVCLLPCMWMGVYLYGCVYECLCVCVCVCLCV